MSNLSIYGALNAYAAQSPQFTGIDSGKVSAGGYEQGSSLGGTRSVKSADPMTQFRNTANLSEWGNMYNERGLAYNGVTETTGNRLNIFG